MPHKPGSQNFSADDTIALLELALEVVPLNVSQWEIVAARYNTEWAEAEARVTRTARTLQKRYNTVRRMKKPTGEGTRPHMYSLGEQLEDEIKAKVGGFVGTTPRAPPHCNCTHPCLG